MQDPTSKKSNTRLWRSYTSFDIEKSEFLKQAKNITYLWPSVRRSSREISSDGVHIGRKQKLVRRRTTRAKGYR